ncbi:RND superfamily putative drug exporter [Promicromonospora sp. AC04]|uniref:MMPL family transporter n=1 Tax=Promicromonospora sp. AC04 TaxID=2135723 RepID=UPI000D3D4621|nr:MMPL family transporter [Promicromonospora sp. AC04]PUB27618.1 RND superfamily putative drug exporter [Promicromonospora sp. AC04]
MSSFLYRLGRAAARRRALVVVAWLVALLVCGTATVLLNEGTDDTFAIPGSESQDALDHLGHVFPEVSGTSAQLVLLVPEGEEVDTADTRKAVADAVDRIEDVPQVALVSDPFSDDVDGAVSDDGRAAIIAIPLSVDLAQVTAETKSDLTGIADDLAGQVGDGAEVYTGGDAFSNKVPKLSPTEAVGLVIALFVLLLMFRSLIAAVMPLVTAVLGVGVSVAVVYLATIFVPVSSTAPMLAVMLGLAVGIDYALFLLSRHRDQLAEGLEVEESIARATATAGSAVVFAGLTVVIALLGLSVAGIPFLTTMGVAAAFGVAVAVCVAETFVPALLSFAGTRLVPKTPKAQKVQEVPKAAAAEKTGRRRRLRLRKPRVARPWVRFVTRKPLITVAVVVIGLGAAALPAADLRLALPDNGSEEHGSVARETYDVVAEHFGAGYNGPLIVTADVIQSTDPVGLVDDIADEIRDIPGVALVPLATPNEKGDTGIIQVVPTTAPDDARTDALVERIRDQEQHWLDKYDTATAVTGITAVGIDVSTQLGAALVPFGLLVVGLSLVLLAMVFRSVWVPVKATFGYLLSVGAAFGMTSLVFQQGHGADLFNVAHVGSVISFLPIILMGVLFGLAMDYEVFLVSRIREHYAHHGDAHEAIEEGFVSASRVVVAAALIMFGVFAAFVPEGSATIKPIAFALAVGVFVDAFLVRMTLVPAVLALLGDRAWGLPPALDRHLPVFDAEGDGLLHELRLANWPAPGSDEVISAHALALDDDRGRPVYRDVELHVPRGEVLVLHGSGAVGKTALLLSLAGRVTTHRGDLKVLGHVLPQHVHALRPEIAVVDGRDDLDPAGRVAQALADGVALILVDDADLVLRSDARARLREQLATRVTATGLPATFVLACQDPDRVADLLPLGATQLYAMTHRPAEVL